MIGEEGFGAVLNVPCEPDQSVTIYREPFVVVSSPSPLGMVLEDNRTPVPKKGLPSPLEGRLAVSPAVPLLPQVFLSRPHPVAEIPPPALNGSPRISVPDG